MAVRYPIISGNWSNPLIWNGGTLPTSADDVYANTFTVTIDVDVTVLSLRNTAQSPALAGGGFVVSGSGYVITCTTTITYAVTTTSPLLTISSTGTNTFNISFNVTLSNQQQSYVIISGVGTVNWVGTIYGLCASGHNIIKLTAAATLNLTGDVAQVSNTNFSETLGAALTATGYTINITGDVGLSNAIVGQIARIIRLISAGTLNITGNVLNSSTNAQVAIRVEAANTIVNITGNVTSNNITFAFESTVSIYLKVVGSILTNGSNASVQSTNISAINIFTGPFICGETGVFPLNVLRMHYFRTLNSYFEFRDETTNGALPPSSPAPATRLVSPDTVVDAPVPANVRDGISYAFGTFTGTLKVPPVNAVSAGVATDNTVGTAVLKAEDVWNYPTASLSESNSIGARLKNVSTVDTTGEQLEALL